MSNMTYVYPKKYGDRWNTDWDRAITKGLAQIERESTLSIKALCRKLQRESLRGEQRTTKPIVKVVSDGVEVYRAGDLVHVRTCGQWEEKSYRPPIYQGPLADYWRTVLGRV